MQVGQEEGCDVPERDVDLVKALDRATSSIEEQLLWTSLDEDAWPEPIHSWTRIPSTKQRNLKFLSTDAGA